MSARCSGRRLATRRRSRRCAIARNSRGARAIVVHNLAAVAGLVREPREKALGSRVEAAESLRDEEEDRRPAAERVGVVAVVGLDVAGAVLVREVALPLSLIHI